MEYLILALIVYGIFKLFDNSNCEHRWVHSRTKSDGFWKLSYTHWHKCEKCGKEEQCDTDGDFHPDCSKCGY